MGQSQDVISQWMSQRLEIFSSAAHCQFQGKRDLQMNFVISLLNFTEIKKCISVKGMSQLLLLYPSLKVKSENKYKSVKNPFNRNISVWCKDMFDMVTSVYCLQKVFKKMLKLRLTIQGALSGGLHDNYS